MGKPAVLIIIIMILLLSADIFCDEADGNITLASLDISSGYGFEQNQVFLIFLISG